MCLIAVAWRAHPRYELALIANRDEFHARPTAAAGIDPEKPFVTSGIRLGTPAGTTRGFGETEFRAIGGMIAEVVEGLRKNGEAGDGQVEQSVAARVRELCQRFPIYQG